TVGGRKVNDGGLATEDGGGIDRPGVRAKVRVAPLHERGNGAEIRRLHAVAVFGAEEAVVQIAHHFFKGVGRGFLEAFPLLKNSLSDVHHEAAECLALGVAGQNVVERLGTDLAQGFQKRRDHSVPIKRGELAPYGLDSAKKWIV